MIYRESKVYFDGSHYIAIPHTNRPPSNRRKHIEELIEVKQEQSADTVAQSTEPVRDEEKEARTATAEPDFFDDDIFEEGCVYLTPETAPFPFAFDAHPQSEEQNPATVRMTRKDLFERLYAQTADLSRKDRKGRNLHRYAPVLSRRICGEDVCRGEFQPQDTKSCSSENPSCAKGQFAGIQLFLHCDMFLWTLSI